MDQPAATILIVDDQPSNLQVLFTLLRQENYKVLVAESGEAALDIAQRRHPDAILLDVMMPDQDGFSVCRKLKQQPDIAAIPVIFLTALNEVDDKTSGFDAGGVDFISKPFHAQEVLMRVRTHLALRRQQQQLANEKELLAVTLRSIGDAVITTDTQGQVTFLNRVAENLTGWTLEETVGQPSTEVFQIINEKTGEKCASPVQRVLELGRIIGLANHTALVTRNGAIHSIADSGAPIRDRDSQIIGVVIVFRDITQEKRLEEELLKARKLESIGVLAGGIAHDFNNILAMIQGNLELAGRRLSDDQERVGKLLAAAGKATERAVKLTHQLLTFSKGGEPIREATALPELLTDSANFVLQGSKASCRYSFADDLWQADIDAGQISQVVQNIVINADQAMPEGGAIDIQCMNVADAAAESLLCAHEGDYIKISIRDSGVGMPAEMLEKIFDPYFTTKQRGSGLGLAICHSIINKHDGYLTVSSTPGKGTEFICYLPALRNGQDAAEGDKNRPPALPSLRVIVMEDEEMLRELIASQLTNLGHTPILTCDGKQAINRYQELLDQQLPVDVVIMDLTIPGGMGGQEAATELRRIEPNLNLIVASGYSTDPVLANYRDYGFNAAICKPFTLDELNQALAAVAQSAS